MNHNEKKERTIKGTKYILENGRWVKAPSTELDPHDPDSVSYTHLTLPTKA